MTFWLGSSSVSKLPKQYTTFHQSQMFPFSAGRPTLSTASLILQQEKWSCARLKEWDARCSQIASRKRSRSDEMRAGTTCLLVSSEPIPSDLYTPALTNQIRLEFSL